MMETNIFLQGFNSKKAVNTSEGLNVSLRGKRKLLPTNDVEEVISQNDVYFDERKNSNIIRLTCQVNPICSNVLFNQITEVVKNEGSPNVSFLNYGIYNGIEVDNNYEISNKIVGKSNIKRNWNITEAIRDTQITNDDYIYHCGADIFNNHLVRSKTFKAVCDPGEKISQDFNTIKDLMRDSLGNQVTDMVYLPVGAGTSSEKRLHVYEIDDIYQYKECVEKRLKQTYNGWLGFENKSKIKTYKDFGNKSSEAEMEIERPIMYMNGGDFVDMYPDRTLYSFVPKYNKFRNRIEKNWNYCLTYPSSSYTPTIDGDEFSDIIEPLNDGLKAIYFNENTIADNGVKQLVIYSIAKHGLAVGDFVNIYRKTKDKETNEDVIETVLENAKVMEVADDYIFTVFSDVQISNIWFELSQIEDGKIKIPISSQTETQSSSSTTYILDSDTSKYFVKSADTESPRYYVVENKYVNVDDDAQEISFKKVVNDIECDYYVRIFSKIPNFKYASADTSNEYEIYKNNGELIKQYQDKEYDFENHISKLAFARNVYSDDIGEIVFTDDIDISNLKDNLGRPLTSIYLTITKNNKGYKEWYGFDSHIDKDNDKNFTWGKNEISASTVEFSHCFGGITCGLETSYESRYGENIHSINLLHNITDEDFGLGYNVDIINGDRDTYPNDDPKYDIDPTEVWFDLDKNYYGDLSYYDNYNAVERHIQPILHRFNTAQRECARSSGGSIFASFIYDEIKMDDYDGSGEDTFEVVTATTRSCNDKKEGYYYNPHYEIKLKTFDKIKTMMPDFLTMTKKENVGNYKLRITVLENHYLSLGDKCIIYDTNENKHYNCTTVIGDGDDYKTFTCMVHNDNGEMIDHPFNGKDINTLRLFKMDNLDAPSYAKILKDGTCRVIWRDVVQNGFNLSDKSVEEYPFTNGAFYVNKRVDLYVRRQDPYNLWGLYSTSDPKGIEANIDAEDNYVKETEIVC